MSNPKKSIDPATAGQMSLFEAMVREELTAQAAAPGSLNIKTQVLAALSSALRHAGKSREQIADEMSAYVGEEITVHMINAWVCQSKENHRFPLEYLLDTSHRVRRRRSISFMAAVIYTLTARFTHKAT